MLVIAQVSLLGRSSCSTGIYILRIVSRSSCRIESIRRKRQCAQIHRHWLQRFHRCG